MRGYKKYFKKFWKYRELLKELVIRDLKLKYRRSFLGYLWSLLNPLFMMIVIDAVFSNVFRMDIENFPVYLITGQVIFNFFSESTNMAMTSIISNGTLIKKVNLPKYIFPISKVLSSFVNLFFSLMAVVIVMLATRTPVHPSLILFPTALLYILIFCIGMGLILSVVAVYFRDLLHLYGIVLMAWTYFTPIFYPVASLTPKMRFLMRFNPMFHFVEYFRNTVFYGSFPTLRSNLVCATFAFTALLIGVIIFKKKQDNFVLYI